MGRGYDDIKDLVRRALYAGDNYNLLFVGPPTSAKTLFLLGILESRKGVYFDGSNTTNRILDILEEERPRVICSCVRIHTIKDLDMKKVTDLENPLSTVDPSRNCHHSNTWCSWLRHPDWHQKCNYPYSKLYITMISQSV